jgi:transcriptional regulator with XRE-family HTH domain
MTGAELKAIRDARDETQAEFGEHFGVDQSTVHRWETLGIPDRGTTAFAIERVVIDLVKSTRPTTEHGSAA